MWIRTKGYQIWDGEIIHRKITWLPMFLRGIKEVPRKKGARFFFFLAAIPFFIFAVAIYAASKPELDFLQDMVEVLKNDSQMFHSFFTNSYLIFMLVMICLLAGSDLISSDLKYKSLPLYFMRPLTVWDYLAGKASVLMFYLLLFTLVPGILLVILKLVFQGEMINVFLLGAVIVFPAFVSLFLTGFTLLLSSLSESSRITKVLIFVFYLSSDIGYNMFKGMFGKDYFAVLSLKENIVMTGSLFFKIKPPHDYPPWISFFILLALLAGFTFLMKLRVTSEEKKQ